MSAKAKLLRLLGDLVLEHAVVTSCQPLGQDLLWVHVQGTPQQAARYQAGDKVQVLLPGDAVRTYTPIGWDAKGCTSLLVRVREDTPASRWARDLRAGDGLRFVGPGRSLQLPEGPLSLIGDETSVAVAVAYSLARPGQVACAFASEVNLRPACAKLGLTRAKLLHANQHEALAGWAVQRHRQDGAGVGLTGGASLIQSVRSPLRQAQVPVRTRAYWAPGKKGLD